MHYKKSLKLPKGESEPYIERPKETDKRTNDGLKCDHNHSHHIPPAQKTVFTYPWTANTITGRDYLMDDERDSLKSGKLSMIAEEP
jgi:hypothetical protein